MCLGLCYCILEFLPYLSVVVLPVLGSFLGVDVVLRVSLLLCVHSAVISFIPKTWLSALPFFQVTICALLAMIPLMWLPWQLVWIYGQLFVILEPLLLIAEVVLIQNIVMRWGQHLAEKIECDEHATLAKVIIIVFSSSCYAVSVSGGWELYNSNTTLQNGVLLIVALLFVAVHNMFWMAREGVISDAAFCSLCMVAVLAAMSVETQQMRHPLPSPTCWIKNIGTSGRSMDLLPMILSVQKGSRALSLLMNVIITPYFLLSLAFRLYSIIFIVSKITNNFFHQEEEHVLRILDDELLDPVSPWRSPLLLKLSVICMMTQQTVLFLQQASGQYLAALNHWIPMTQIVWPQQVLIGRLLQLAAVFAFYIWRLYCADDWTWCEWLTPW